MTRCTTIAWHRMRNNTHITIPINGYIYSISNSDVIRHTILAMLPAARAHSQLGNGGIDASTKLLSVGLVDSKDLLDIILEVEARCGVVFNPERINFETGITLGSLVGAFDAASG